MTTVRFISIRKGYTLSTIYIIGVISLSTVVAGIQILPNGKDDHTKGILTEIVNVIKESGLTYEVGPLETVVEGELDTVLDVIKKSNQKSVELGANEVLSNIKIQYRPSGTSIKEKKQ